MGDRDVVVLLRFDVVYRYPITELPAPYAVDWTKVNIAFRDDQGLWMSQKKVSDLMLIFPVPRLPAMTEALQSSASGAVAGPGHGLG